MYYRPQQTPRGTPTNTNTLRGTYTNHWTSRRFITYASEIPSSSQRVQNTTSTAPVSNTQTPRYTSTNHSTRQPSSTVTPPRNYRPNPPSGQSVQNTTVPMTNYTSTATVLKTFEDEETSSEFIGVMFGAVCNVVGSKFDLQYLG